MCKISMINGTKKPFNKFYLSFLSHKGSPLCVVCYSMHYCLTHFLSHSMFILLCDYHIISGFLIANRILGNKWEKMIRAIARMVI